MSRQAVEDFIQAAAKNKDLRGQLEVAGEVIVAIAKAAGYKFTKKELHDVLRKKWAAGDDVAVWCG